MTRYLPKHKPCEVQRILKDNAGYLDLVNGCTWDVLEVLSTDFTELRYASGSRKTWFMATVDITSKWAPGLAVVPRRNRQLAHRCWQQTRKSIEMLGTEGKNLIVHQDQDAVYTSCDWLRTVLIDSRVRVSYSEMGANGKPVG